MGMYEVISFVHSFPNGSPFPSICKQCCSVDSYAHMFGCYYISRRDVGAYGRQHFRIK
jgi:hypothetical protein